MVIAALIALQLAAPLAELPPQPVPPGQCALFLWDRASGRRIAMLGQTPPILRLMQDGKTTDLPADSREGDAVLGFGPTSRFHAGQRLFDLRLIIAPATAGGALVQGGSLTITEADGGAVVIPVAGLAGCPQ
ncbi:MAG: hypothetical protein WCO11_09390 [Sphingomonadales bacterium]|jgi:hypothetical protein